MRFIILPLCLIIIGVIINEPVAANDIVLKNSRQQLSNTYTSSFIETNTFDRIERVLQAHYRPKLGDPPSIKTDLRIIAIYYSIFPEVVSIIKQLEEKSWNLEFKKNTWSIRVRSNMFQIKSLTIMFDTRIGIQMIFKKGCRNNHSCIIPPADAFLHELLHPQAILQDPEKYIYSENQNPALHLYTHEAEVIKMERKLYAAMTRRSGEQRPQRYRHTGRILNVACSVCIYSPPLHVQK